MSEEIKKEELDEDEKMRRIKMMCPGLYIDILSAESKIYKELEEKVMNIKVVKDLVLDNKPKKARILFENLVRE